MSKNELTVTGAIEKARTTLQGRGAGWLNLEQLGKFATVSLLNSAGRWAIYLELGAGSAKIQLVARCETVAGAMDKINAELRNFLKGEA